MMFNVKNMHNNTLELDVLLESYAPIDPKDDVNKSNH